MVLIEISNAEYNLVLILERMCYSVEKVKGSNLV